METTPTLFTSSTARATGRHSRLVRRLRCMIVALTLTMLATACGAAALLEPSVEQIAKVDGPSEMPVADETIEQSIVDAVVFEREAREPRPEFEADEEIDPEIELGDEVGLTPRSESAVTPRDDGGAAVVGTVDLPTAAGPLPIENAEVIIAPDPVTGENTIIGGVGTIPFPTVGELADVVINHLPVGIIGSAYGRELHHLGAHLVDDRKYLYFHFDGGLDVDLPMAGRPGFESLPPKISVPTGKSATFVIDPTDPYFYIGGACPQSKADDNDDDKRDNNAEDRDQDDEPKEALYTIPAADLPPGEDCGFGFSLNGNIPAPAAGDGAPFDGHLVLDGLVPLYPGIELDGSTVFSFNSGLRAVGWGDVVTSIPLMPELLDIQLPLGNALVELQADGVRVGLAMEGTFGSPQEIVLPLDIPVRLPSSSEMSFSARLGMVADAAGNVAFDPDSHMQISGSATMGLGDFGRLIGLDLSDMATQDVTLRIDPTGVRLTGVANGSIHPSLQTDSAVTIEAFISANDPASSFLTYSSDIRVLGTEIFAADVDLSRRGLFVSGTVNTGAMSVAVSGQISDAGVDITGTTAVEIDLDALSDAATAAEAAIDDAIAEVERLDAAIEAARDTVRAERRDRDAGFRVARDAVEAAKRDLKVIDDNITKNNKLIAKAHADRAAEKKRYSRLSLIEKGTQAISHNAKLTALDAQIVALEAANLTQKGYRPAAQATLTAAQEALKVVEAGLNALPVDTDPRVASLIAARESAVLVLENLRNGFTVIGSGGGVVRGEIEMAIGTSGVGGSFVGEVCNSDRTACDTITGGRVTFVPAPELCVEVFGLDEMCLPI